MKINGKNQELMENKKLKLCAVPTLFCHLPLQKEKRKSPKKKLQCTPSPIKRARKTISEHSYSIKNKLFSHDDPPKILNNNLTVLPEKLDANNFINKTVNTTKRKTENYSKEQLVQQINNLKTKLLNQAKLIRNLRQKINIANKIKSSTIIKTNKKKTNLNKNLRSFLTENQILSLNYKNKNGFTWSSDTIQRALRLKFACGANGYEELLNQHHPLPSLRTLRRKLQNRAFESGILNEVFEMLSIKVSKLNTMEKECVLVLDEIFIVEGLVYDVASKSFVGDVTLPEHNGIANHALVFMLAGISSRWKQTVAYYFTGNSVKGHTFKSIMIQIISKAESLGLKVNLVTSDMGASNKAMWTSFGIHCLPGPTGHLKNSTLHPCDSERELYFLPDVPHLFKNIKQSLFNNKLITLPDNIVKKYNLTSNIVDCKHIEKLANHQNDHELKLVRKLDSEDLQKPNHFDKMKVSTAANIINTDVSASLQFLVDHEGYHSSYKTTAWFIKEVAKWFTLMTSINPIVALSKLNLEKYNESIEFLYDFMDLFKNIKIGSKGTWKPCQAGVLLATKSVIDLQNIFLNDKSYKFLLTGRFSQDCLENLFSCIRTVQPIPNELCDGFNNSMIVLQNTEQNF